MNIFCTIKKIKIFWHLFFITIIVYAVLDFQTSRNTTGEIGLERSGVHLALFCTLCLLSAYFIYSNAVHRIIISTVKAALWSIFLWILISNLSQTAIEWSLAVHLGLSAWWVLTYHFFCSYLRRFDDALPLIQKCITIMFSFYVISALYGCYNIRATYEKLVAVNLVYNVIVFLPWITLIKSKYKRLFFISIVFLVVMLSMKRGALLVFPLMLCAGLLVDAIIRKQVWITFFKIFTLIVLLLAGIIIADHTTGGYLLERFSPEEISSGSGRFEMYGIILENLSETPLTTLLLGRGSGATEQLLGMAAHNEWLEFLYNFGVVGSILYALLFITLIVKLAILIKGSSRFAPGYAMAVVYLFVIGMLGQIYFAHSTFFIIAFLGTVEALRITKVPNLLFSDNFDQLRKQGTI